jgi:CheY-like chemotaxis protein
MPREELLIMVVTDGLPDAKRFTTQLRQRHQVFYVSNIAEAREALGGVRFNVLLAEPTTAANGGWCDVIRRAASMYPLTAIAVSKVGGAEHAHRSLEVGFAAHLATPVNRDELGRLLKVAAARKREAASREGAGTPCEGRRWRICC